MDGRECMVPSCSRPLDARGMCKSHYDQFREALRRFGVSVPTDNCDRCQVQLDAYAGDSGYGDRPLLAGTMTMSNAAAYMLGFFDRASRSDAEEAIDPYIVRRFHELRLERMNTNG